MTSHRDRPLVSLLCGPAGAGKTTWARERESAGAVRLSMDEAVWDDGWRHGAPPEHRVLELDAHLQDRLLVAVRNGRDVVVDISSSTRHVRDVWREAIRRTGARCRLVVVRADLETLLGRVAARDEACDANRVRLSPAALRDYVADFEWPGADEPHELIDTSR